MFHSGSRIRLNTTSVYHVEAYSGFMLSGLLVSESVTCLGSAGFGGAVGSGAVVGAGLPCAAVGCSCAGGGVPQPLSAMLVTISADRTIQDHLRSIFSS